jgi:hypothetical protein
MGRWAARVVAVSLVYEARGLLADERAEIGSWRRDGPTYRAVRALERGNVRAADGVLIVMSRDGERELGRRRSPLPPHRTLPNSVDVCTFTPRPREESAEFGLAYCGSLGGWYMTEEMARFACDARGVLPGRVLVLTPNVNDARQAGFSPEWADVRSVTAGEVPRWLRRARVSFFLIRPTPAKKASSPTKVAESLACGLPIIANEGIGDLHTFLEQEGVGVLIRGFSASAYREGAERMAALLRDPGTPDRCRRLAEERFSLDRAVAKYHDLYRELAARWASS